MKSLERPFIIYFLGTMNDKGLYEVMNTLSSRKNPYHHSSSKRKRIYLYEKMEGKFKN